MRKRRVAVAVALVTAAGSVSSPIAAHAASATTFYVNNATSADCSDSTTDSLTTPYCTIQAAVNAASSPGDTVSLASGLYAPFTVTASGTAAAPITIENPEGDGGAVTNVYAAPGSSATPITVNGASYVSFKGIEAQGTEGQTVLDITGSSSHISVDSSILYQQKQGAVQLTGPDVEIDGGSSDVTLSRNTVDALGGNTGILAQDSSGDVITTNRGDTDGGPFLALDQATNADVTSNTAQRACGDVLSVSGGSTSTSIENNIVIGQPDATVGGCPSGNTLATATIQVDASSSAGTVEDYNNVGVSVPRGDTVPPYVYYSWAGTGYDSSAALNSATGQGAHDSDPTSPNAAIDSANSDAPGELSTDILGNPRVDDPEVPNTGAGTYGYYDRGASETVDPITFGNFKGWGSTILERNTQTFSSSVSDGWPGTTIATCSYAFGDGTPSVSIAPADGQCTAQHTYSTPGTYVVALEVTADDGYRQSMTGTATAVANQLQTNLQLTTTNSRTVQAVATPSDPYGWKISECDFSFGDGTTEVAAVSGSTCQATHVYSTVGTYPVSVTVSDSGGEVSAQTVNFESDGYYYNAVTPVRVLDTRQPIGVPTVAKVAAGGVVKLKLTGTNGIPDDAGAVALNVTATNGSANGYVTVYPDGTTAPSSSNLNFAEHQTVPNTVIVQLGADGTVDLKNNSTGTTDLVADLQGYYGTVGAGYVAHAPTRLVDTRVTKQTIPANGTLRVYLGSTGESAAALNVTVTDPTSNGFITAYPDGAAPPSTSSVNYGAHQTIANEVMARAGANGYVDFENVSSGAADLIVDLNGLFEPGSGSAFVPLAPSRIFDTRAGAGPIVAGTALGIRVFGSQVPTGAVALAENVTVTEPTRNGYILAFSDSNGGPFPIGSTVNFSAGQTVANAATVGIDTAGDEDFYNGGPGGTTQLVVDLFGYYY